jgi:phenylalanyl-tRNA synthetase beta chain
MKDSLLVGLLHNTAANVNQGLERVALFEIGKVFAAEGRRVTESPRLAISACGLRQRKDWRLEAAAFDFAAFKSLLAALGRRLRLELSFRRAAHPAFSAGCCFAVLANGRACGTAGEAAPALRRACRLELPVFAAEIELETLVAEAGESRFRPWNRFPAVRRDVTFLVPEAVPYERLAEAVERLRPAALEGYELTDVFRGAALPPGQVSLSLSCTYRVADRTLTGDEANAVHQELTARLAAELGLIQR